MESKMTPWFHSILMAIIANRRIMNIARHKLVRPGLAGHVFGSLGLLAMTAFFLPASGLAQGVQPAQQVGGTTSLPTGSGGQARVAGKDLDSGGISSVPQDFSKL